MPYIEKEDRIVLDNLADKAIDELQFRNWELGHVNYYITRILNGWWKNSRRYFKLVFILGTLVCVALEFYRRVGAPYEDRKRIENGDVFNDVP